MRKQRRGSGGLEALAGRRNEVRRAGRPRSGFENDRLQACTTPKRMPETKDTQAGGLRFIRMAPTLESVETA